MITKESIETRFQAKREEFENAEREFAELQQRGQEVQLRLRQIAGQLETLQELHAELEIEESSEMPQDEALIQEVLPAEKADKQLY